MTRMRQIYADLHLFLSDLLNLRLRLGGFDAALFERRRV
jgi:hypothetical protein